MKQGLDFVRSSGAAFLAASAPPLAPLTISSVKRWYRLQASTPVSSEYQTITEVLGGAALSQTAAARKPAADTSSNGLPVATFDGTDVMMFTLDAAGTGNNGTSQWWTALRIKPPDFGATQSILGWSSAAGTAPNKLGVSFVNDGTGKLSFTVFASGFNGRIYTTPGSFAAAAWNHLYIQFDGTRTNEADLDGATSDAKVRIFSGTTALAITATDTGTGGAVSALLSSVGTGALGGANDNDTPTVPLRNGTQIGPNIFFGTTPLTSAELAALVNFEVVT